MLAYFREYTILREGEAPSLSCLSGWSCFGCNSTRCHRRVTSKFRRHWHLIAKIMEMILEITGTKATPAAKFNGRTARPWVWRFNCLATCWRARRRWRKRLAATRLRTNQTWAKLYRKPKKLLETSTTSMNLFLWPVISLFLAPTFRFPNSGTISLVCGGSIYYAGLFSRFLTQSCQSSSLQAAPTCCSACHPPRWPKMQTLHHLWHFQASAW